MAHVLIFTPTYGDLLRPETVASVEALEFEGRVTWEISRHNPHDGAKMANVLAQYQRAQEMLLAGDYDALLTVEHDMVVPPDALQKLWETAKTAAPGGGAPAAIVYGVYMLRHGSHVINAFQYIGERNVGQSLSLHPREVRKAMKAKAWRVSGAGFGCTLIRREVLEMLWLHGVSDSLCPDLPLAVDVNKLGLVQMARFDVPCLHYDPAGGVWMHPYGDNGVSELVKVRANVLVHAPGVGRLEAGRQYELPAELARELERAGYVSRETGPETAMVSPAAERAVKPRAKAS